MKQNCQIASTNRHILPLHRQASAISYTAFILSEYTQGSLQITEADTRFVVDNFGTSSADDFLFGAEFFIVQSTLFFLLSTTCVKFQTGQI